MVGVEGAAMEVRRGKESGGGKSKLEAQLMKLEERQLQLLSTE
jgi:hypothetical protein